MPGKSHRGALPPLTEEQIALAKELQSTVSTLATEIGERNVFHAELLLAAETFLYKSLTDIGYTVRRQTFPVGRVECSNLEVEIRGTKSPEEILVVGAHYDAVPGSPAANDNGSGTAATLALARAFFGKPQARTLRFVFFVNEEPPFFWTDQMGSLVYAREAKQRGDNIVGMLSLETIGYYSDEKGSQKYPPLISSFYPSTGNFIGFVGMSSAKQFVRKVVDSFRRTTPFPSEGAALPWIVPRVGSSDHWAFWKQGYPALMVTDTAPYRYPHYHQASDTAEKLDYDRMARVVSGLRQVIEDLATGSQERKRYGNLLLTRPTHHLPSNGNKC